MKVLHKSTLLRITSLLSFSVIACTLRFLTVLTQPVGIFTHQTIYGSRPTSLGSLRRLGLKRSRTLILSAIANPLYPAAKIR